MCIRRIYLTEWSGAVLGANVFTNRNVLFDLGRGRIGFADARCDYGTVYPSPPAIADDDHEDAADAAAAAGEAAGDGGDSEEGGGSAEKMSVGDGSGGGAEKDSGDQEGGVSARSALSAGRPEADTEKAVGDAGGGEKRDNDGGVGGERRDVGGRSGGADYGPEMACLWRLWEPCKAECVQGLPEVAGCSGKREVRGYGRAEGEVEKRACACARARFYNVSANVSGKRPNL